MEKEKAKATHRQKEKSSDVFLDYNCSLTLRRVGVKNKGHSRVSVAQRRRGKDSE